MTKRNSRRAVLHLRKLKGESGINLPSLSKARLKELIEQAIVDAYGEEKQAGGFFTMIEEHLALPLAVKVLGVDAEVERVDMTLDGQIVAICRRGKTRQKSQSWTCLCQRRHRRAWNGLSPSPLAPRVLVSEYQYYDFRAIDRPLTKKEMGSLRSISTRAAITTTSFTNHYEWGDLKANPSKLLEKYFDTFVYVANWGTHEFYIRLPQESVDYKLLKAMVPGETVRVRKTARFVIVEFGSESEWDGEDDGTGWMASLMPLRSDLLRGDLRCLYLGWLRGAQDGGLDEDEMEPPVPAGLQELS